MKYINILITGVPEKKKKRREEGWKCIWRNYSWKLSNPEEEEKRYPGTGSTEGSKQDEFKQTHTKIYHN